ncbi:MULTISPECIES: hypothetical protein [Pseudoalteromonas]|uniref:2-keto-4-pentenoate hydratase n=1 Tax=Pseudoalteromonas fuliginea TaxID=1872678 RepID=A0ABD3Y7Z2_9GAMM|nr:MULTISPECIES: hypothetical protein [Pseudoalteromonas]ALQ07971.1 2-keto-4-pentenoate hydratase [Pseudoalteromonas sp. Bsw20308]KDC50328.1 2-keto-4-pentenoate hydratase [Pseudoalteromonas fuliginea]KDC50425.1 2-keto-4-pentenoate hydratase [Pseudoalteromonas sp. S3431]KJZ27674.1 2-keto-4-pentenoate hydratase [Pseudoalteromonas fuliginea]
MTNSSKFTSIAKYLLNKRGHNNEVSDFPENLTISSMNDVINVQKLMIKLNNNTVYGWKCMLPLDNGAYILAPLLHMPIKSIEHCELITKNDKALMEPEIAFVLNKNLDIFKEYKNEEVDNAIGSAHLALELIQNRFTDDYSATHFEKLADGLSNQGVYLGPKVDIKKVYESSNIHITVKQGDRESNHIGKHPAHLPQEPLYWAINFLAANGFELKTDQIFITGSYNGVMELDINEVTSIKYEGLGEFKVEFVSNN